MTATFESDLAETYQADERYVIGAAILATSEVRAEILESYRPSDLTDPRCRFVDGLMRRMQADGVPIDVNSISQYARRQGEILDGRPRMALFSWVLDVAAGAPVPASATYYAVAVVENSARGTVRAAADELRRIADSAALADLQLVLTKQLSVAVEAVARAVQVANA